MFRIRFSRQLLLALSGLLLSTPSVMASDSYPEIMFILDSSGSMSQMAGGRQKIAAAKEVMQTIVPQLHENVRVGLTAYGHRHSGDCQDIEVLVPPGSTDRAGLLAHVNRLQPRGKTPISAAILSAASQLRLKDAETTIILVSDGIETCGGDPCEVVKQLKATGSKFVMHVIGFDVNPAAEQQLKCAAGAGDGTYFSAGNADQLLEALKTVLKEVQEKVQQVEAANVTNVPGTSTLGKLKVTMPVGSEVSLADLKIMNATEGTGNRTVEKPKPSAMYPLKSGSYRVELGFATPSYGAATRTELGTVEVKKGETKEIKLGSVSFNIPESLEKAIAVREVLIADAGTNNVVVTVRQNGNSYYHFKPKPIAAGIYNVMFRYSINRDETPSLVARGIVVAPGKDTVVTLAHGFQLQEADDVTGWDLIPVATRLADSDEDGSEAHVESATLSIRYTGLGSRNRLWYPHVVPPGRYNLNVLLKGMDEPLLAGEGIVIQDGQIQQFDAGL